jgi:hypothetical protein
VAGVAQVLTLAEAVEWRCTGFVETCHGYWYVPLRQNQLPQAQQALGTVKARLDHAYTVKQQCADLGTMCWNAWRARIGQGRLEGAEQELVAIEAMLARGDELQARCNSWPCRDAWRGVYRTNASTAAALTKMGQIQEALPDLNAAAAIATAAEARQAELAPDAPLAQAQHALAAGEIAQARTIAIGIVDSNNRQQAIARRMPFIFIASLVLLLVVGIVLFLRAGRRAPRPPQPPQPPRSPGGDADLLAALLAQPPAQRQRKT